MVNVPAAIGFGIGVLPAFVIVAIAGFGSASAMAVVAAFVVGLVTTIVAGFSLQSSMVKREPQCTASGPAVRVLAGKGNVGFRFRFKNAMFGALMVKMNG